MTAGRIEPLLRYLSQAAPAVRTAFGDGPLLARFAQSRDEAAFAILVRRHGPMVLGVCRRILQDAHAAEDAFQATFLLLARKAASLTRPERLGSWLHGVARRTATRARVETARRRARESRVSRAEAVPADEDIVWRDLRPVLDEEVERLPPRYRLPFVLCYLQGRTNAEAASVVGCSRGTVATLLARARERLRRRLSRRGLGLPAGLLAAALAGQLEAAPVPAVLALTTARAAALFVGGNVSTHAAALAKGVATTMLVKKLSFMALTLLMVGLAGTGLGFATLRAPAQEPASAVVQPAPGLEPPPVLRDSRAVVQTTNFAVTAPTPEIAEQVARAAERNRKALAQLWLGREMPDWSEPCPVRVKITEDGTSSATSFQFDHGAVQQMVMLLEGPCDQILADLLPHEITHIVLACHFRKPIPRWKDEGAAMLSESAPSRARYEKALREVLDGDRRMPLRLLLASREYPKKDLMAFYAQSYSIADFLVQFWGRSAFLSFVGQGLTTDLDTVVREHYGFTKAEDLEQAWLRWVGEKRPEQKQDPRKEQLRGAASTSSDYATKPVQRERSTKPPARATSSKSPIPFPVGPAPVQALVSLDDNEICIRKTASTYKLRSGVSDKGQDVNYWEPVTMLTETRCQVAEVRVYDHRGEPIERKELPRLLTEEILALVSADGRPVDPLHLRLTREGALLFVVPMGSPPPSPPPPVPEPPRKAY
jgi:RNA polymerase sigma factor (sigma-70 family)